MIIKKDYSFVKIAVLLPCFNESKTIVKVIQDFKKQLPNADIYVFDNNSTDGSFELAKNGGAIVLKEKRQGKGFVVNSMFSKVNADIYVMVDADDTYPAEKVHELISPVLNEETDMTVGQRLTSYSDNAFRPFHHTGNRLVCSLINAIFGSNLKDPMSGYRVFNRSVAIELPIVAGGFDVETEMTLQLLYRHFKISEIEVAYRERPQGSFSKLNTFKDGFKVLYKIFSILQAYKPLTFFGGIGLLFWVLGIAIGAFVVREYILFQYIYSVPKAIAAAGLGSIGVVFASIGIILHIINFRLLEIFSILTKNAHLINERSYRK